MAATTTTSASSAEQRVEALARDAAVRGDELSAAIGDGIVGAEDAVGRTERLGTLVADQTTADDRDRQPVRLARATHTYSLDCAPTKSKSNGSSVAPAAAIACRVSAGLRA